MARRFAGVALVAGLLACGSQVTVEGTAPESTPGPPADWQTYDTACGYSFRAPDDFVQETVIGTDSCVVRYESAACVVAGDYGWYSDPLDWASGEAEYRERSISVDSRDAKLVTYRVDADDHAYRAAMHVPDVNGDGSGTKLTLYAECSDAARRDEMIMACESVRFD